MSTERYSERVMPSLLTFALSPLLGLFAYVIVLPLSADLGLSLAVITSGALAASLYWFSPVISADSNQLRVGRAVIDRKYLGVVTEISPEELFAERGHRLDARAFTSFQPTVRRALKIALLDPRDPAPYWLFSTRRPGVLKTFLET
jgi:hypothetical protein